MLKLSKYSIFTISGKFLNFNQLTKMMSLKKLLFTLTIFVYITNSQITVAIIGSNDIHGSAFPTSLERSDTKQKYKYGGLVYMASLIKIINEQNSGNTLYLDAGDQFQGGIQSSKVISNGMIMTDFYNAIKVGATSIGNHQFDFGPDFLFPYMVSKDAKSLAANIRSEKGEMNFLPDQKSSILYEMANGIRVGAIGLSTLQTPSSTAGFSTNLFPAYKFMQYKRLVEDQSQKLKKLGANLVIIVSHVGDACASDFTYKNRTKQTVQDPCPEDQITKLIKSLEKGTIHGVVQGHRHKMAHHYINDVPYIGSINGGYYINVMYFRFDDFKNLIDSKIQGPIPVCQRVFQNTGRCNYLSQEQLATAGQLKNWSFHNVNVTADPELQNLYNTKWLPKMQPYLVDIVQNQIELVKDDTKQFQLANLFTNLLHEAVPEGDFVIVNPGSFRTQWMPGIIQYQHFYNMNPFSNIIQTFQINGSQMLEMFRILQNGQKGFYQCWNIQMEVSYQNQIKRFISAKFIDGTEIDPVKTYIGVTIDFLLKGGDDFSDVIGKTYTPRNVQNKGDYKELTQPILKGMGVIKAGTLINPDQPRLIVC